MVSDNISNDLLNIAFRQLGASKIKTTPTKMNVIEFKINEDLTVSYLCNAKGEAKIYLQRIEPYPIRHIKFEDVDHIIEFVKQDLMNFKNASQSTNFGKFLEIANKIYRLDSDVENLFLFHNVNPEDLDYIDEKLGHILDKIEQVPRIKL
ncbi:MAG: hypothetical protein RR495_06890 [Anaerovoracaceae bacterium]